jgi:hypothetical protein
VIEKVSKIREMGVGKRRRKICEIGQNIIISCKMNCFKICTTKEYKN